MIFPKSLVAAALIALLIGVPQAHAQRRSGSGRAGGRVAGGRVAGGGYAVPRAAGPRANGFGSGRFYRPYYAFRPRVSLGVGLWLGYPYFYGYYGRPYYPYYYPYGYGYAYPYPAYPPYAPYPSYPYPPPYGYSIDRNGYPSREPATGGLSFNITPSAAEIFVDGEYAGTADDFTPTTPPLDLRPGRHRVEVRAPGYRTMAFDADVTAWQVTPYRATLQEP